MKSSNNYIADILSKKTDENNYTHEECREQEPVKTDTVQIYLKALVRILHKGNGEKGNKPECCRREYGHYKAAKVSHIKKFVPKIRIIRKISTFAPSIKN